VNCKVNPSNASFRSSSQEQHYCAHLQSNIIEPLQGKKMRLNTPGEFRLPATCCTCIVYLSSSDVAAKKLPVETFMVGFARDVYITGKFLISHHLLCTRYSYNIISRYCLSWSRRRSRRHGAGARGRGRRRSRKEEAVSELDAMHLLQYIHKLSRLCSGLQP
jgi:hypothetical protein